MRIGLFTDTYHPASNGVVVVVDTLRRELEAAGHEVWIFAPDGGVIDQRKKMPRDEKIIRLPAIQYDMQLSLFLPTQLLRKIRALKLDVINFFTPAQVGMMAALAARKTGAVLVGQHSTDTYEFSKDYFAMALGYAVGGIFSPLFLKLSPEQKKNFAKLYFDLRQSKKDEKWAQRLVAGLTALLYSNCDGVVAVSEKSGEQLQNFAERFSENLNLKIIPTGVDKLPPVSEQKITELREKLGLKKSDEIVLNFGRMAEEKNLELLIKMMPLLLKKRPHAKLLFAGDYVYLDTLKKIAARSPVREKFFFAGRYDRADLPAICATAKIFAFPSLTDTQALVLNEAAHENLPIVMCDQNVNQVFQANQNGLLAENSPEDFADKIAKILADEKLRQKFARNSGKIAQDFSEKNQTEKLIDFYRELLRQPLKNK